MALPASGPALLVAVVGPTAERTAVTTAAAAELQTAGRTVEIWDEAGANTAPLIERWPALVEADIVLCALSREGVAAAERELGRSFDLQVDATEPGAAATLRAACADFGEWTRLGLWGGAAGGVEVGVGSALHALRVPLRGLALCSTQAAMLTFASQGLQRPGRVAWVSFIAAGLKAFSPGGGRLRPMAAITLQGALYAGCVQVIGRNLAGLALGGALIGVWAALQGFFLQYLLLGTDLIVAYDRVVEWLATRWQIVAPSMPVVLAAWAALHMAAAAASALVAWRLRTPPRRAQELLARDDAAMSAPAATRSWPARIGREFLRWQFWLPFVVVAAVLTASGGSGEHIAWLALRFVAVGFLVVTLLSLVQPAWLAERLRRRGWWGPALALQAARRRRR